MGTLAAVVATSPPRAADSIETFAKPVAARSIPPFDPLVPLGESALLNDVTATRSDSDVVVSFDLPLRRTRRPAKFEEIVRETLGGVYGTPGVEALDRIPTGDIASQGDLLTVLPQRGAAIPVRPGWAIRVYPVLRDGRDGPLVVRYRAVLVPATE